uniref:Uncharacterized protein n=2 Tax=Micrococcus TaxID=1269 RepID=U5NWF3_9MICC|nr:hypothetical protein [Micrococcus sp. V7]AGY35521.1 hypothetical protein LMV7_p01000 [Micrococcus sp. V7]
MGGMSAEVWPSLVGSLSGALVGGLSAYLVSGRTLRGQAYQGKLQRLEAALAELILGVQALYGYRPSKSEKAPAVPDEARVRVLLLTDSEKLDEQLRWACVGWLERWRLLYDYVYELLSEFEADDMVPVERELEAMVEELVQALRKLKSPEPEHVTATLNALTVWRVHLEALEDQYRNEAMLGAWGPVPGPQSWEEDRAQDSREGLARLTVAARERPLNAEENAELNRRQRAVRLMDLWSWSRKNPLSREEQEELKGLEDRAAEDWAAQDAVVASRRAEGGMGA